MTRVPTNQFDYNPPRFKWTKRIAWSSVGLVLLVPALWGTATIVAQHRLDSLTASYRKAGEPLLADDFNVSEDIPNEENAAIGYLKAEYAFVWPREFEPALTIRALFDAVVMGPDHNYGDEVTVLLQANQSTLKQLSKAAKLERLDWQLSGGATILDLMFPDAGLSKDLGSLLAIAAIDKFDRGDHEEAIGLLRAMFRLGKHRLVGPGSMVMELTGVSIAARTPTCVERFADGLKIASSPDGSHRGAVSNEQIEEFIFELLEDEPWKNALRATLAMDRAFMIECGQALAKGQDVGNLSPKAERIFVPFLRPVALLNVARATEYENALVQNAEESTYSDFWKGAPDIEDFMVGELNEVLPANLLVPRFARFVQLNFFLHAERRMAAITLAMRLYELENGQLPDELDDLVPKYLPSIPLDPFSPQSLPIRYTVNNGSARLYSLGLNLIDDGGESGIHFGGRVDRNKGDLVFYLNGDRLRANKP